MGLIRGFEDTALRYFIYVFVAGFFAGFTVWAALHEAQLAAFILKNQLSPDQRDDLIGYLGGGVIAAHGVWFAASLVLTRKRAEARLALAHVAAWLSLLVPCGLLPALLIPNVGDTYRFLTFSLIIGVSGLLYLAVREIQATRAELRAEPPNAPQTAQRVWQLSQRSGFALVALLSVSYGVYFSVFSVSEHNTFHSHAFDLGIFDQVMYHATQQGKMLFTIVHNPPENFWSVHFSPALYLLTPFYALYQDAKTLLVLQSFLLGAGALVVYALTRHLTKRSLLAGALSVSYLLYAALHGVNTFDFHEVALAPLFLLLTLYCLETNRLPLFWVFLVLSLLIKEDIPLTGAAIGLYILAKGRTRLGLAVTGVCTLYFFTVIEVLIPYFGSGNYNLIAGRFGDVVAPGSEGIVGVVETGLTNPLYLLFYIVSNADKLAYLGYLFVPVLFLPLLAGRAWLVILPALATALLSSFGGQFMIGNQYPAPIIPLVYFLAASGLSRVPRVHHAGVVVALLASSLLMNYNYGRVPPAELFSTGRRGVIHAPTPYQETLQRMVEQVPPDVSVAATGTLVPHLSTREVALMLPTVKEADFVLADLRQGANYWPTSREGTSKQVAELLGTDYGVRDYEASCCVLLERGRSAADNARVLLSLP